MSEDFVTEPEPNNYYGAKRRGSLGSCPRLEESFTRLDPIKEVSLRSLESDAYSRADSASAASGRVGSVAGSSMSRMSSFSTQSTATTFYLKAVHESSKIAQSATEEILRYCTDCGRRAPPRSMITGKRRGKCENEDCNAFLCKPCKRRWVLQVYPNSKSKDHRQRDWRTATFKRFCRRCYMHMSTVDFNSYSEVIEPMNSLQSSNTTIIFTHREGWSRASFRPHAKYLAEKYGHRSILMDYSGHGSRWNEECTAENCVKAVSDVLVAYNIPTAREAESKGQKTVFASSSWGGIMAYHVVAELKDYFSGVIFDSCCFNISSPFDKLKRTSFISFVMKRLSNYNQVRLQRTLLTARGNSYVDFMGGHFCAGVFGESSRVMKKVEKKDLAQVISEIKCPVLFFNGTKNRFGYSKKAMKEIMNLLEAKEESKVALFDGGDHLISHDLRFFSSWVETAARFIYYTSIIPKEQHV